MMDSLTTHPRDHKRFITDAMNRYGSIEIGKFHLETRRKHPALAGKD
jgi:hypothetical protein